MQLSDADLIAIMAMASRLPDVAPCADIHRRALAEYKERGLDPERLPKALTNITPMAFKMAAFYPKVVYVDFTSGDVLAEAAIGREREFSMREAVVVENEEAHTRWRGVISKIQQDAPTRTTTITLVDVLELPARGK